MNDYSWRDSYNDLAMVVAVVVVILVMVVVYGGGRGWLVIVGVVSDALRWCMEVVVGSYLLMGMVSDALCGS